MNQSTDHPLVSAARAGDVAAVEANIGIIRAGEPINRAYNGAALMAAVVQGHLACVKLLIPLSDAEDHHSVFLRLAARDRHTEVMKYLIPFSDTEVAGNAMIEANQLHDLDVLAGVLDPLPAQRHLVDRWLSVYAFGMPNSLARREAEEREARTTPLPLTAKPEGKRGPQLRC